MKKIKLGIYEELTLQLGTRQIGSVFPINAHEMVATTMREIRRFEGEEIKECVPYTFSCACFMPEVEFVVAHTVSGSEIWVMRSIDLAHPILTKYKTGQTCVYHMIYSPKSKSIITIGSGIKVFTISWELKGSHFFSTNFEVTITCRSEFADDYDASLLNPPSFDDVNERLFLPTPAGVCAFDLDGELISFASKLPADNNTSYAFCRETQKLLTFDPTDGLCLWKTDGTIDKRINVTSLIIIGLRFIDTENVICLSSTYSLHLLNIKTCNIFECYRSPPHTRLNRFYSANLHYKPYVFMCYLNKLTLLRINAPWRVFSLGIVRPLSIQRYSKSGEAARIGILTDNSFVKLFSPKKNNLLVSLTPSMPIYPSSFFYDRGVFVYFTRDTLYRKYLSHIDHIRPEKVRDFLYLVYEDGNVSKFDVSKSDPTELWLKKLRAKFIQFVFYKENWCLAISHLHGMLSFVDIDSFERIKEISLSKKAFKYMFYSRPLNCLIFIKNKSVKLFDLETELFKYKFKIKQPTSSSSFFGDTLYLGYEDGSILRYQIVKWSLNFIEPEVMTNPHELTVTSFDFSPNFYLSSSLDMTVIIWNYFHSKIIQLKVPYPIYCVAFHGVKRHLLIGSKDSLMMLQGDLLFGEDSWDPELIGLDSYDLLDDKLDPHSMAIEKVERSKEKAKEDAETAKKFEKIIINSSRKIALKKAMDEFKKNQEELIEQFKKDSEMGVAAKSPEARQRTVDQMIQLLDLTNEGEDQSKSNAAKNARLFIKQKEIEDKEKKIESSEKVEIEIEEEESENDEKKKLKESKNSVKAKKFVSGADFIKQQTEIEKKKKKSGKRKSKRKRNDTKDEQDNDINEKKEEDQNKTNLLDLLNSKNQKLNKSPNKKSKVEIDISKMNFVECTTENKEEAKEVKYEYYTDDSDNDNDKKVKKKSKKNKNLAKAKSLSKINMSQSPIKKGSKIQLNDKNLTASSIIQTKKNPKTKSNLKSEKSTENISKIKNKKKSKISPKSSRQSIDKLNEKSQIFNENDSKEIPQFMNYEYVNDDGEIVELPEGQFVNKKGQIVNADGQLVDENGDVIDHDGKYRYRDSSGKISFMTADDEKKRKIDDFEDCIFVDDYGRIVKKHDVYLNDYGEYVDPFGEALTKVRKDNIIISDGQLVNNKGQKINANGDLISGMDKNLYSEVGCQVGEDNFTQRSFNSKIHKLTNFFHPKNPRYRPSTPPPIHWDPKNDENVNRSDNNSNSFSKNPFINKHLLRRVDSVSRSGRSRTPPQLRTKETLNMRDFSVPDPNCVLDSEAVLAMYGRGHTELLPIVVRLIREGTISPSNVPILNENGQIDENVEGQKLASPKIKKSATSPRSLRKDVKNKLKSDVTSPLLKVKSSSEMPSKTFVKKSFSQNLDSAINRKKEPRTQKDYNRFEKDDEKSKFNEQGKIQKDDQIEIKKDDQIEIKKDDQIEIKKDDILIQEEEEENLPSATQSEIDIGDEEDEETDEHHITFILPDQNDNNDQILTEIKSSPTPPIQPPSDHDTYKRGFKSSPIYSPQQPLKPPTPPDRSPHLDTPRKSPRRNHNNNNNSSTNEPGPFQLTSSEIYEEKRKSEVDFTPRRRRRDSTGKMNKKDENEMIRQKRRNQKQQKGLKFEILGVPVYRKDVKNKCLPPEDNIDDQWPIPLNQKGRKFEYPEQAVVDDEPKQKLYNSDNSDDDSNLNYIKKNEELTKFQATRSTRTTPNSLSMARFYGSQKEITKSNKKSIIDYSYLLEPGAVEEPRVADDIVKNFEDKEDILFSLRSMFPKTNQMAMMIQTPKSIKSTRYSRSLQEYSNEYVSYLHSKNIKVQKKKKK